MKSSTTGDYMSKSHRKATFAILIALIASAILLSIVLAEMRYKNNLKFSPVDTETIPVEMTIPEDSEI